MGEARGRYGGDTAEVQGEVKCAVQLIFGNVIIGLMRHCGHIFLTKTESTDRPVAQVVGFELRGGGRWPIRELAEQTQHVLLGADR